MGTDEGLVIEGPLGISADRLDAAVSQAGRFAGAALAEPATFAVTAIEALAAAVIAVVLLFFLLRDGPRIARWLVWLAPERSRPRWAAGADAAWTALARYARGAVIIAAVDHPPPALDHPPPSAAGVADRPRAVHED